MIFLFFLLLSISLMQAATSTTKHVIDFEESAKTFSPEVATEIVKNIGTGFAQGTKEWAKSGEQAGSNFGMAFTGGVGEFINKMGGLNIQAEKAAQEAGKVQATFLTTYNKTFSTNIAPRLLELKRTAIDILINPRDILYYSSMIGIGFLEMGALAITGQQVARIVWEYVDRLLKKPKIFTRYVSARSWYQQLLGNETNSIKMIFDDSVKLKLDNLIDTTSAIYNGRISSSYSNILLYGAPGTGKTLFARYFAEQIGMEYAETTGGAFLQEGAGVAAVNSIFDYAKKTKGLILFIDEADSLFVDRNQLAVGQNAEKYEILNHLLNLLGEPNNKLMVICATNHPVVFDEAMSRRFTQAIEMPLPDRKARRKLFGLYFSRLAKTFKNRSLEKEIIFTLSRDKQFLVSSVALTDGMSGSDIETVIRLFGNDLALHVIQNSESQFNAHKTMQAKIAEYRKKMILLKKDRP